MRVRCFPWFSRFAPKPERRPGLRKGPLRHAQRMLNHPADEKLRRPADGSGCGSSSPIRLRSPFADPPVAPAFSFGFGPSQKPEARHSARFWSLARLRYMSLRHTCQGFVNLRVCGCGDVFTPGVSTGPGNADAHPRSRSRSGRRGMSALRNPEEPNAPDTTQFKARPADNGRSR